MPALLPKYTEILTPFSGQKETSGLKTFVKIYGAVHKSNGKTVKL